LQDLYAKIGQHLEDFRDLWVKDDEAGNDLSPTLTVRGCQLVVAKGHRGYLCPNAITICDQRPQSILFHKEYL